MCGCGSSRILHDPKAYKRLAQVEFPIAAASKNAAREMSIEVKKLAAPTGTILLTPNERRVAEDRRDRYWLYVVTNYRAEPRLEEPVEDPARFPWHEVTKVACYYLPVNALSQSTQPCEPPAEDGSGA